MRKTGINSSAASLSTSGEEQSLSETESSKCSSPSNSPLVTIRPSGQGQRSKMLNILSTLNPGGDKGHGNKKVDVSAPTSENDRGGKDSNSGESHKDGSPDLFSYALQKPRKKKNYEKKVNPLLEPQPRYFLLVFSLLKFFLALSVLSLVVGTLWWFHVRLSVLETVMRREGAGKGIVHSGERNAREREDPWWKMNINFPPFPFFGSEHVGEGLVSNEVGNGNGVLSSVDSRHSGQPQTEAERHHNDQFIGQGRTGPSPPVKEKLRVSECFLYLAVNFCWYIDFRFRCEKLFPF